MAPQPTIVARYPDFERRGGGASSSGRRGDVALLFPTVQRVTAC